MLRGRPPFVTSPAPQHQPLIRSCSPRYTRGVLSALHTRRTFRATRAECLRDRSGRLRRRRLLLVRLAAADHRQHQTEQPPGNGRDRFRLRKAQYELLDRFAPSPQLQVALAGLLRQAQEQRLAHWEPALVQPLLESALGYPSSDATTAWAEQLAALDLSAYWYLCSSKPS